MAGVLIRLGIWIGWFACPEATGFMHVVEGATPRAAAGAAPFLMFSLNLLLGTFNLLPLPPLDGFGAVGSLLSEEGAQRFQSLGNSMRGFSYLGLLLAWQVFDPLFAPILSLSLNALYPGLEYGG